MAALMSLIAAATAIVALFILPPAIAACALVANLAALALAIGGSWWLGASLVAASIAGADRADRDRKPAPPILVLTGGIFGFVLFIMIGFYIERIC